MTRKFPLFKTHLIQIRHRGRVELVAEAEGPLMDMGFQVSDFDWRIWSAKAHFHSG